MSLSNITVVRYYIGDTDADDPILTDEIITYFLSEVNNIPGKAAVLAARACAAHFSQCSDETVGKIKTKWSDVSKAYLRLAEDLEKQRKTMALSKPIPFLGGASITDLKSYIEDPDRVDDGFILGQFDNIFQSPQAN